MHICTTPSELDSVSRRKKKVVATSNRKHASQTNRNHLLNTSDAAWCPNIFFIKYPNSPFHSPSKTPKKQFTKRMTEVSRDEKDERITN